MRRRFPTLAVIVLVFALVWFLTELGYLRIDIPWIPLLLIIISIGWIFNRLAL